MFWFVLNVRPISQSLLPLLSLPHFASSGQKMGSNLISDFKGKSGKKAWQGISLQYILSSQQQATLERAQVCSTCTRRHKCVPQPTRSVVHKEVQHGAAQGGNCVTQGGKEASVFHKEAQVWYTRRGTCCAHWGASVFHKEASVACKEAFRHGGNSVCGAHPLVDRQANTTASYVN